MKQTLLIVLSYLLGQASFSQSDSVYLSIESKLFPEIQMITPNAEIGTRENYNYFKYRYWLVEVDTVSLAIVDNSELRKSKNKKVEYQKYAACDSIINQIRNNSSYWKMRSEIDNVARQEIGYGNNEFNSIKNSDSILVKDVSEKCQDEFKIEIAELKTDLKKEIERIKKGKTDRFTQFNTDPKSINSAAILSFLESFDLCKTDFKSLELIIVQNPTGFLKSIDNLSDSDFFTFTLKLNQFPNDANISAMKEELKASEKKGNRKKKVIRKIKKGKTNL